MEKVEFMGIRMDNVTMDETLLRIVDLIKLKKNAYVITPNVNHVVKVQHDPEFKEVYDHADLVLVDGMPLVWASKILKKPLKDKVSGSDLFPLLCGVCEKQGYSIFLMGGTTHEIIQSTVDKLKTDFPKIKIAGFESPVFGFDKDEIESARISKIINDSKPDVLFIGVGAPKQEKWIFKHRSQYNAAVSVAIGAAFNFYLGHTKRAPKWMQRNGLEWLYRVLQEPRRLFKRLIIENSEFFVLLVKELLSNDKPKAGNTPVKSV